jgi:hypothetical protein
VHAPPTVIVRAMHASRGYHLLPSRIIFIQYVSFYLAYWRGVATSMLDLI